MVDERGEGWEGGVLEMKFEVGWEFLSLVLMLRSLIGVLCAFEAGKIYHGGGSAMWLVLFGGECACDCPALVGCIEGKLSLAFCDFPVEQ